MPSADVEEFVPFVAGEPHWTLAGAEKPEALARFEAERAVEEADTLARGEGK